METGGSVSLTLTISFSRRVRSEARLDWVEESRAGKEVGAVELGCEEKEGNCTVFGGHSSSFVVSVLVGAREHICLLKEST